MTTLAPGNLLEEIQSKLANGAVSEAGAVIDKLWAVFFEDPNLYLKALYHRLSNQPSQALTLLTELTTRYPDMARAHQEIALNSLSVNEPKAALRAAGVAVALDASLVKAWELLEPLHRTFTPEKLGATQDQIRFLKSLPPNYAR
ncbi:MAG: hypothetical protein CM15mP103_12430 [Gammaproteobacteria bacterium]|nr:MAG: hypothetical protein CM15mP103_12430 [Gammaproteobacteria bacterium]